MKEKFMIASAATSREEIWGDVGNPIYPPAKAELKRRGIGATAYTDFSGKRAVQVTKRDYEAYDYILCADSANIRNTTRIMGGDRSGKIRLLLDYTDRPGDSIADPWYTGDFVTTYEDIIEGLTGFMNYLRKEGRIS
ncbi:MAG: low molecular weight phosphotyrosine protein phosphatase [Lachnospiraceae bacterium]|nr:low molecular weight phosphotyrosine protein phosphatase [Lachnospiraceae bacterium]